jgi:hypothetical protein
MTRSVLCVAIFLLFTGSPARAQDLSFPIVNGASLAGVTEFDARLFVTAAFHGSDTEKNAFQDAALTTFVTGLVRAGITPSASAPNFLDCELSTVQSQLGIAYNADLFYYVPDEAKGLWSIAWRASGVVGIGEDVSPQSLAQECVDQFLAEWKKHNP